jgi:endonuclease YncB( thermonuclease family)
VSVRQLTHFPLGVPQRATLRAEAITALLFALATTTACAASEITGCHDGDTCYLKSETYTGKVRVFCIDAPELDQVPWGAAARDAINAEVRGTITVAIDTFDRWGRPVAELIRDDGRNLGLELVRAGYAAVYPKYCDDPLYYAAEIQARAANAGIWRVEGAQQRPWEWRKENGNFR